MGVRAPKWSCLGRAQPPEGRQGSVLAPGVFLVEEVTCLPVVQGSRSVPPGQAPRRRSSCPGQAPGVRRAGPYS